MGRRIYSTVSAVSDGSEAPTGWVRVTLESVGAGVESGWGPWPAFGIGANLGLYLPPRVGQPVRVDFADDDPLYEFPDVLYPYFNDDVPPPWDALGTAGLRVPADVTVKLVVGDFEVTLAGGTLQVGGNAEKLALASKVESRLNALEDAVSALVTTFNAHVHTYTTAGPQLTTVPTTTATAPSTTAADDTASGVALASS